MTLNQLIEKAALLRDDFERRLVFISGGNHKTKVLVDIKNYESAFTKMIKKGIEPDKAEKLKDVLRAAILVHHTQNVETFVKRVKKVFDVVNIEYKRGDKGNPYRGAYHIDVLFGGIVAEIQVMPRTLWAYKEEAHKYYKNGDASKGFMFFNKALTIHKLKLKRK